MNQDINYTIALSLLGIISVTCLILGCLYPAASQTVFFSAGVAIGAIAGVVKQPQQPQSPMQPGEHRISELEVK